MCITWRISNYSTNNDIVFRLSAYFGFVIHIIRQQHRNRHCISNPVCPGSRRSIGKTLNNLNALEVNICSTGVTFSSCRWCSGAFFLVWAVLAVAYSITTCLLINAFSTVASDIAVRTICGRTSTQDGTQTVQTSTPCTVTMTTSPRTCPVLFAI